MQYKSIKILYNFKKSPQTITFFFYIIFLKNSFEIRCNIFEIITEKEDFAILHKLNNTHASIAPSIIPLVLDLLTPALQPALRPFLVGMSSVK